MNGEQARVWKEAVTTYLKILTQDLRGDAEKDPNNPRQCRR
jgi:hypothetical protein